ncbi:AAA family ATPase, partial [Candidatus Bathyarchaeota archaeon]|nr:AAA family ATPase [Candidatus Bathyarchaeota archaeon]
MITLLLDKILLENITVHKQTVIEFKEGVNVLSGLNGTGKTTILNMIGYAMFNFLPQNQKEYVRRAKNARNYGTVKLWFTGKEGEQFSIKRTLGKTSNLRIVKHVATGMTVDNINSEYDFESWLKDHLSLDQASNLGDLFNNAIGVPQGTFTAPFLFTASRRKKIFGPILNLEIYETFYRNYRDVNNLFTEEINKIENQASRLKGSISDKGHLLSKRREIKSKLESEKVKRKVLSGKLERITGEIELLSKDKQHLELLEDMKLKDENKISSLEESMKILKPQRDDARKAKKICDDTIGEHRRYLELKEREQELRKRERELLPAKEEKHHHDTAIATLKTSVEQLE